MNKLTILVPHAASAFGAEMSTLVKAMDCCAHFVFYEKIIEIIEIKKCAEIDLVLINSAEMDGAELNLLTAKLPDVARIDVDTDKLSGDVRSMFHIAGESHQSSLSANLVRAATSLVNNDANFVPEQRLIVKDSGHIHVIKVEDLAWVGGAGNYVELHMINRQRSILHRDTMSAMEKSLKSFGFSRIHKSSLVNLNAISELKTRDNGDYDVILENGDALHLSRRYKQNLSSLLQTNIN